MAGPILSETETNGAVRPPPSLDGARLVVASHNPGKLREIVDLFEGLSVTVESAGALGLPEPEENGRSFVENALIKARAARAALIENHAARAAPIEKALVGAKPSTLAAIADDSGLVVPALGGAPGILSARWAGPEKNFAGAMKRVHEALTDAGKGGANGTPAHFVCVLAVCWADGETRVFEGRAQGTLVWPPRGTRGFGYDPIFRPDGRGETFGEMDPAEKHRISHRWRAFEKLVETCFGQT